jgi:D-alanyl-D-alanine carboxypeptidase/D-alanyl-D-alanine-endopeptidase (penicillin-binding protein 4)
MKTVFSFFLLPTLLVGSLLFSPGRVLAGSADPLASVLALPKASLMLEERGRVRIARHADRPMVPASTMKILTALAAIQRWGLDHRFHTDFFESDDGWLWVRGGGDPFLVSQELDLIVGALKKRDVRSLEGIGVDDSLFAPRLRISGRSSTDNPYDAPVTALAVNFNTMAVINEGGRVRSAESQTPLTPLARKLGARLGSGKHRINLKDRDRALRYFGEVLAAKLKTAGVSLADGIRVGHVPSPARRVYRHENSHDLGAVLSAMLEYSNNFIANNVFLLLADHGGERSLDMGDAQGVAMDWSRERFGWRGHRIEDGAGLSRGNRLSARQLLDALNAFSDHRDLLPAQNDRIRAKTGTLRGVSCYAGFVKRNGRWEPFSLLINQPVAYDLRRRVADALAREPDLARYCTEPSC